MSCDHVWAIDLGRVRCRLCGVLAHASPTQLEDWRACPRKWKYRRLRKIFEVPDNIWAAFGQRAHLIREHWLKSAIWTEEIAASKEGICVAAGIEHWPRPGQALGVEIEIERADLLGDGVPWTFKIDDVARSSHPYDLGDLKTIGQLRYRKTEAQLEADAQRVVYSVWGGPVLRLPVIRAAWTYCQRSPAGAAITTHAGVVAHDRERLAEINVEARAMLAANLLPLDELPRNRTECYRYKGHPCAYASHCLADQNLLAPDQDAAYTLDTMTIPTLAEALAAQAQAAAPAPVAPALPPMPSALPPPPTPVAPLIVLAPELEAWVAQCVAAGADPAATRAQAEAAMVARVTAPAPAAPQNVVAAPQAPLVVTSAAPLAQPTAAGVTHSVSTDLAMIGRHTGSMTAGVDGGPVTGTPAPAPTRGRGRPRKATTGPTTAPDLIAATLASGLLPTSATAEATVEMYHRILDLLTGEG